MIPLGFHDTFKFSLHFEAIFGIVHALREVEGKGTTAIFGLKVKSEKTAIDAKLAEIVNEED